MPASTFGLAIFSAEAIGVALLIAALCAPSYHYESFVLPGGADAIFDLSLFRARVSSHCIPIMLNLFRPIDKIMESSTCRRFVDGLNGRSIRDVANTLCSFEYTLFNLPSTGCAEFSQIWIASIFTILFFVIALCCSGGALVTIIIFFTCRPMIMVRKGVLALQAGSLLFATLACFFFIVVGGSLKSKLFLQGILPFLAQHQRDESNFSYGGGAAVALCATVWSWTLPLWSMWAVKLKYCRDYFSEEDERDEEAAQLMAAIRHEAHKLDTETARSIICPVEARDIINWYTSSNRN